jgi:CheY-like chemotaxis protein
MLQPLRILIVEDEPKWAQAIKTNFLEIFNDLKLPCTIEVPNTIQKCKEAIRNAVERPYDLISLDINFRQDAVAKPIDGLTLLEIIKKYKAAWLVSILTGVESDKTVDDTYGEQRTRELQYELHSRASATFSPERLMVKEKPALSNTILLAKRLRQVCLYLRQSRIGRNRFRRLEEPCQVAVHELIDKRLIKKSSPEFLRAQKAMKFVKEFNKEFPKGPSTCPDSQRVADYEMELKYDLLKKNGTKLEKAQWAEDIVTLRQISFGCGEVITLPDNPNFETIVWLLRHPNEEFAAHQIGGEAAELGRETVGFQHEAPADVGLLDAENDEDEEDDDDEEDPFHMENEGNRRDYGNNREIQDNLNVDVTERDSHAVYRRDIKRKEAQLDSANPRQRSKLEAEIADLRKALGEVRKYAVGGRSHETIKQHKSRAIADLREAGQLELADHLFNTIRIRNFKFCYAVEKGAISWNTY